jgi:hypothetical protein
MEAVVDAILARVQLPEAEAKPQPLLFAVDHCFCIRGQGTVLTGTVLQGRVAVGQTVELPALQTTKKVKSMQMFRRPVTEARRGDRVGICIAQLDASAMERGLVAEPGSVPTITSAVRTRAARQFTAPASARLTLLGSQVAAVEKIRFFKGTVPSKARFHVTLGHATVMAEVVFFGGPDAAADAAAAVAQPLSVEQRAAAFSFDCEYRFQEELLGAALRAALAVLQACSSALTHCSLSRLCGRTCQQQRGTTGAACAAVGAADVRRARAGAAQRALHRLAPGLREQHQLLPPCAARLPGRQPRCARSQGCEAPQGLQAQDARGHR